LRFAAEAFERGWIFGNVVGQKFQGDEALQFRIFSAEDNAHATTAKFFQDAIVRETAAFQGSGVGHRGCSLERG